MELEQGLYFTPNGFCFSFTDVDEFTRYNRDVCLICHDFDSSKEFPTPPH